MPAIFNTPNPLSNLDDIDWNPSTGGTSHWELPRDGRGGGRNKNGWGVEARNETWGDPVGTSAGDARPGFRDPFANPHRRSASHQRPGQFRSYSASGERRVHSIGNMHGHVNGYPNSHDQHRHPRFDDYDEERETEQGSEDEPFFLEDQLDTPGRIPTHPNAHPHSIPTHPHFYPPPYPYPYAWGANPSYPVAPEAYPYGYPSAIPPHSHPTSNAAFFNTGKDAPKMKKIIHRRKSVDDLDWGGNDNTDWNHHAWSGPDDRPQPSHRRGSFDSRGDVPGRTWQNFMEDDRLRNPSAKFMGSRGWKSNDGHRRHASSPTWGQPHDHGDEDEDDLEQGEIRINRNGNVSSGGWGAPRADGDDNNWGGNDNNNWDGNNNNWGGGDNDWGDDNVDSPGLEALSHDIAGLRLNQQGTRRHHIPNHRRESSPPGLVERDNVGGGGGGPVWGNSAPDNEPPYTQNRASGGQSYTNIVQHRNGFNTDPQVHMYHAPGVNRSYPAQGDSRQGESSTGSYTFATPNTAIRNTYENQRRRAYADASNGGSGSGFSIGSGVASQLKEKAMKLLRGAGIGSITLHPILRPPTMLRPNMLLWDVRRVPHPARAGIPIGEAMAAFSEPASRPALQHMHLIVPIPELQGTAWYMDVYPNTEELHKRKQFSFGGSPTSFSKVKSQRKKSSSGEYGYNDPAYDEYSLVIQCIDVLSALARMLHMSATSHDYHALPKIRQKQVYDAFMRRCREIEDPSSGRVYTAHLDKEKNPPEINERVERKYRGGLKRIDFFWGKTRWEGLESNGVDAWTVKLGKTVVR